jgi:HAD superfamily hydrolase (TIGR01509 family)
MLGAVIWDVDGTLAETERDGHRVAFNRAFEQAGLPWRWDVERYGELLAIAGGEERLRHDLARQPGGPSAGATVADLARSLHRAKNACYAELVAATGIPLRPGVRRVIDACSAAGVRQAIATTTSRGNVDLLLRAAFGDAWDARFAAIVCAEEAPAKKPDPLAYRLALAGLGVDPRDALAIEDSPNGVAAATAAGIAVVVTRSVYFADAVYDPTIATCDDLDSPVRWRGGEAGRVDLDVLRRIVQDPVRSADAARDP